MFTVHVVRQYQQTLKRPGTKWTLINVAFNMFSKAASIVKLLTTHVALVYLVTVLLYVLIVQTKVVYS